jgi:hypothetical protein
MENLNVKKSQLLQDIERLIKLINSDLDWFICSITEKDQRRKAFARFMADEKQNELVKLAKGVYERLQ